MIKNKCMTNINKILENSQTDFDEIYIKDSIGTKKKKNIKLSGTLKKRKITF